LIVRELRKEVMAKTFSIDTTAAPSALLVRARRAASENGAVLIGDEGSGRFSHDMARGEYRMMGRTVTVTITDKHWLLPWPVVEAQLREVVRYRP
jgi:hypothetical protein